MNGNSLADIQIRYSPAAVTAPLSQTSVGKPAKPAGSEDILTKAREYIRSNEGVRNRPYRDSKGLWTVGIGHLMGPEDIKTFSGKTLTDQQINQLFERDLTAKERAARKALGASYDRLPGDAKVAVLDGFFRGDLSGSPKTLKLLKDGELEKAATEYLNNAEYRASLELNKKGTPHGVARRMERNAAALRSAAKAVKSSP